MNARNLLACVVLFPWLAAVAAVECVFHRGLHCSGIPENTVESIRAAYESGARWVETDFNLEPDGSLLCYHDAGKRAAVKFPYHVPTIDEVLAVVPKDGVLQCEIKTYGSGYAERFEAAVARAGLTETNICVSSFDYAALADFRRRYPKYRTVWLVDMMRTRQSVDTLIAKAKVAGFRSICPGCDATIGVWGAKEADAIRAAGLEMRVYGVNSAQSLEQCAVLGALAFTCNFPHEAFRWAKERGVELAPPRAVGRPAVFRVSGPTAPGERVLLSGGCWGVCPRVLIAGAVVWPDLVSATELVFCLPKGTASATTGTVVSEQGESDPFDVNFPEAWWLFGDEFDYSTPGGVLRVFGRSLGGVEGRLVDAGGAVHPLEKTDGDGWQTAFAIPGSFACGAVSVEVRTPLSGTWRRVGEWSVGLARTLRKADVFRVTDFGAVANDAEDDTAAVSNALAAAAANGGGMVFIPRGRFKVHGTLAIPPRVLVKGASQSLSCIYWQDTMTPPTDLVTLREGAGISDLMLSSGQHRSGITAYDAKGNLGRVEDILLENLTLRFVSDQQRDPCRRGGVTNFLARYRMLGTAVKIPESKRVRLRNVDVYTDRDGTAALHFNIGGEWIDISGSKFRGTGYSTLDGGPFVFERNEGRGTTFSLRHYCNRMYFGKNTTRLKYAGDREAVTLDGGRNAFANRDAPKKGFRATSYYLAPGSADGVRVTLESPPEEALSASSRAESPAAWVGRHLRILAGRGAGQTRRITAADDWSHFEIDRPFDVSPDRTSRFELTFERSRILIVDNVMEDVGLTQLYGGATEVVIAGNVANRAGGFEGYGLIGRLPCWSVQFLGNRIVDGNNLRGPHDPKAPHDAIMGSQVLSGPFDVPMNRAFVIRDNVIEANGRIMLGGVHGAVVEGNAVSNSDFGIVGNRYPNTCWIGRNSFANVDRVYSGLDAAAFDPGAKMLSADARAANWLKNGEGTVAPSGRVWRVGRDVKRGLVKFFCEDGTTGRRDHGPYPLDPSTAIVCGEVQKGCGHLQGVATDGTNFYWSSTMRLVKTDAAGNVLVARDVESHHGDLCVVKGVLYVAVNLGNFNTDNEAKSFVRAYRTSDLAPVGEWAVPELVHGAGGITARNGRFFVVGGLPPGRAENFVYEYDGGFRFLKRHVFSTGYTYLGIQTADWDDVRQCFVFGCYGLPGKWTSNILVPATMDSFTWERPGCPLGGLRFAGLRYLASYAELPDGRLHPFLVPLQDDRPGQSTVLFDGKSAPCVHRTSRKVSVSGAWDVSQSGFVRVTFARPVAADARVLVRLMNDGAVPPDIRCNESRGTYETYQVVPKGSQTLSCVLPPFVPTFHEVMNALKGVRVNGLLQLIWPNEACWHECPWEGRVRAWTLDPHRVTKVEVVGWNNGSIPDVSRIELTGVAPRVHDLPDFARRRAKDFFPFIDRFGQFKWREWPGKIHCEEDLRAQAADEDRELARHPGPADRNKWGGWAKGPSLRATGAFRVEKVDGRWWFVDPDGRLWWSFGPVRVSASCGMTPYVGRESHFEFLPKGSDPLSAFYHTRDELLWPYYVKFGVTNTYDFTAANLYRKYGADWRTVWADRVHRRLRSWGANTIANSSDLNVMLMDRTPYCDRFELKSRSIAGTEKLIGWWPFRDPFDPSFRAEIRRQMSLHRREMEDPWCFGFFVDNELQWGGPEDLARWTWESPQDQPARLEFERRLTEKYGKVPDGGPSSEDFRAFSLAIVDGYFSAVREEFKRAAPDKLYMGCRFSGAQPFVVREAAKFVDVMSYNYYEKDMSGFDLLPSGVDKPVIIGEFHFGALDRGPIHPGLILLKSQEERAATLRRYVETALENPNVVGVHWHQFCDDVATGRFDGENMQIGWVDVCDTPYVETVAAVRDVGGRMYEIRQNGRKK